MNTIWNSLWTLLMRVNRFPGAVLPTLPTGAGWSIFRDAVRLPLQRRVLLVLLALSSMSLHAKPFGFAEGVRENAGLAGDGAAVAIGDVNHDGRDDLVVAEPGRQVVFRLQAADGRLQAPVVHALSIDYVQALEIADIDRDGHAELLVGSGSGLAVYAHGRDWRYLASGAHCRVLDLADIDRDGWTDVVCMGEHGRVSLYLNDHAGGLAAAGAFDSPAVAFYNSFLQIVLRDVTDDGNPDLIAIAGTTSGFYVHPGDGAGGFLPPQGYVHTVQQDQSLGASGIAVIDVDGDGVEEIVVANGSNTPRAALYVHRKGTDGYFRHDPADNLASHDIPTAPIVYDIDRDGREDLLVVHGGWDAVGRYMAGPHGLSRQERLSRAQEWGVLDDRPVALGDVNGDGCTDMAIANSFGMQVFRGICLRTTSSDFDGDGESDLFWRNTLNGQNMVWRSADAGRVQAVATVSDTRWRAAGQGDFDGDGLSDVLWRHAVTGANVIWRSGDVATQQPVPRLAVEWTLTGVGDFDGDGRSDLLWRHSIDGRNMVWNGGREVESRALRSVTDLRWQVAGVADFNGDVRSDILWRHTASGSNAIWRSGAFSDQQGVVGVTDLRWQVAGVGDLDGDGRADLLWRHATSGVNAVWRGANYRSQHPMTDVTNVDWNVFGVADFNGDGYDDVFWRNVRTGSNAFWLSGDFDRQVGTPALRAGAWDTPSRLDP